QNRVAVAAGGKVEEPAEPADLGVGARPPGASHDRLDRLDQSVPRADIDAGAGIGRIEPADRVGHLPGISPIWRRRYHRRGRKQAPGRCGLARAPGGAISTPPRGQSRTDLFVTIPNLISIGRLFLVPLTIWLLISARSDLGGYLDPLADKALLISIYVTFAALNEVHVWVTILIVTRDILIIGGVIIAWMLAVPMAMRPNWISKVNTLGQIVYAAVILADLAFTANLTTLRMELAWVVGGLTVISTFAYALEFVRHMGGVEGPGTPSPPARP